VVPASTVGETGEDFRRRGGLNVTILAASVTMKWDPGRNRGTSAAGVDWLMASGVNTVTLSGDGDDFPVAGAAQDVYLLGDDGNDNYQFASVAHDYPSQI
jgi:hypothetical protein